MLELKKFLYIPDDKDYSGELARLLEKECDVLTAKTVQEAATRLQSGQPIDTLFMDNLHVPTNNTLARLNPNLIPQEYKEQVQRSQRLEYYSSGLGLLDFARKFHKEIKSGVIIEETDTDNPGLFINLAYLFGATVVLRPWIDTTPELVKKIKYRLI